MRFGFAAMVALATVCGVHTGAPGGVVIGHMKVDTTPRMSNLGAGRGAQTPAQLEAWACKRRRSAQRKRGRR